MYLHFVQVVWAGTCRVSLLLWSTLDSSTSGHRTWIIKSILSEPPLKESIKMEQRVKWLQLLRCICFIVYHITLVDCGCCVTCLSSSFHIMLQEKSATSHLKGPWMCLWGWRWQKVHFQTNLLCKWRRGGLFLCFVMVEKSCLRQRPGQNWWLSTIVNNSPTIKQEMRERTTCN